MHLDSTTIIAAAAFVAGMSGAFLLVAGGQLQQARPTTIWGVANLFIAVGMMLVLQRQEYNLAFLSVMVAGALTWVATARFNNKNVPLTFLVAGVAIWTFVSLGPWDLGFGPSSAILLVTAGFYFAATAAELWLSRGEALPGRWPVLSLVMMNAVASWVGAVELFGLANAPLIPPGGALWFVYISTVAFTIGSAVFFLAMTKERSVAEHEVAAVTDSLTGLANRGALIASGTEVIAETLAEGRPVAVAVFDLDHFKLVNDTFGHRTGDAVLRRFAESAIVSMRATDLIGRIGGEEFAAIIPGAHPNAAMEFAERVRSAFASRSIDVNGRKVRATVSSGVAVAEPGQAIEALEELLDRADAALYVAKASGRDCVSLSTAGGERRSRELLIGSVRPAFEAQAT